MFVSLYYCALARYNRFQLTHVDDDFVTAMKHLETAEAALKDKARYEEAYRLKSNTKIALLRYELALAKMESAGELSVPEAKPRLDEISALRESASDLLSKLSSLASSAASSPASSAASSSLFSTSFLRERHVRYTGRFENACERETVLREKFAPKDVAAEVKCGVSPPVAPKR